MNAVCRKSENTLSAHFLFALHKSLKVARSIKIATLDDYLLLLRIGSSNLNGPTLLSKCVEIHKTSVSGLFSNDGWTLERGELFSILLNPWTEVEEEGTEDSASENHIALQVTSDEGSSDGIMNAEDLMVLHALLFAFMKHIEAKVSIVFVRKSDKAQASLYKNPRAFRHIETDYNVESATLPTLPAFRIIMKGQSFLSGRITNIFVSLRTRSFIRDAKIRFDVSEVSMRMTNNIWCLLKVKEIYTELYTTSVLVSLSCARY